MPDSLRVLFEDNHLLVIDKPSMIPTMGVDENEPSLVKLAKDYLRDKYAKPGNVYLGVVSRLDSWVSGVIVLARTSKAAARLSEQFRNRTAGKEYLALIPDRHDFPEQGTLENWMVKDESHHRMRVLPAHLPAHPQPAGAQLARLAFKTVGRHEKVRLLEIELLTGRKHQIRVQLSAAGVPILGDKKYGSRLLFSRGIALHSNRLTFEHPTLRTNLIFQASPPRFWNLSRFR